jgi:hypothetical protein
VAVVVALTVSAEPLTHEAKRSMTDTFDRFSGARATYGIKKPCRAATTANITLSGYQTIDGVTYASSDEDSNLNMRCLVKNQTSAYENGIYEVNSGAWTRTKDFDGNTDFCSGTMVAIVSGTSNGGKVFYVSSSDMHTIGTSSINFTSFDVDTMMSLGDDVASATTVDLTSSGQIINITGTTTIGTITVPEGNMRLVRFSGALTLTHSSTLVLPGSLDITTTSGDWAIFTGSESSVTYCSSYQRHSSHPLTTGSTTIASAATVDLGSAREQCVTISGAETITSFGTSAPTGAVKHLIFSSSPTLTYDAIQMILPSGADIAVYPGDTASVVHEGSGNWRMVSFTRKYGNKALHVNTTEASTTGSTAAKDLMSYTMPAAAMVDDGYAVRVTGWGSVAATTHSKTIELYFGGTSVASVGPAAMNGLKWRVDATVVRASSASQYVTALISGSSATTVPALCSQSTADVDMSGSVIVKLTATPTSTGNAEIVATGLHVQLITV